MCGDEMEDRSLFLDIVVGVRPRYYDHSRINI